MAAHVPSSTHLLLVEMPFKAVNRPSIGLSLLRAALQLARFACQIEYVNLSFAKRIGFELYETIAEQLPPEALFGDLVFQPLIRGPHLSSGAFGERSEEFGATAGVPRWLWVSLPDLQSEAAEFVGALAEELLDSGCRRYGLSAMFQVVPNLALARALKERDGSCTIVMGGACCEGEMGLTLHEEYPWIDYVCRGEGERFIVQLLRHLETGRPSAAEIPGLVARAGPASVLTGENTERVTDLEALPSPDYRDWVSQVRHYTEELPPGELWLPIEASRGCWWGQKSHCVFCGLNGENLAFREKSADRVWDEIALCVSHGIKKLYFVDLILPLKFFKTLLPRLAEADLGLTVFYEVKSNLTYHQVELLAAAGVRLLQPGIESLSTPVLRLMRKGVTGLQNLRLLKWAAELGVDVSWNLLYGFPGEDPGEYAQMAELVPQISHLQPPFSGCRRVRIDRFSPLFFDKDRFELDTLRPFPAYRTVFGLPPERLSKLAYFFEPEETDSLDIGHEAYRELQDAVDGWIGSLGDSSFSSLTRGHRLLLFDRRPGADPCDRVLHGLAKEVYTACEEGATARSLSEATAAPERAIERVLQGLERAGLLVFMDEHYLSLAVRMDRWVPPGTPEPLLGPVCHAIYRARMLALKKLDINNARTVGPTWSRRTSRSELTLATETLA